MPPKGDRASSANKGSSAGNKSSQSKADAKSSNAASAAKSRAAAAKPDAKASNAASAAKAKSAAAAKPETNRVFGAGSTSTSKPAAPAAKPVAKPAAPTAKPAAPTSSPRPAAKPAVAQIGTGKNKAFLDTRTGVKTAAPKFGAFSFRGLTSTDPANVARNRAGAARMAAMNASRDRDRGSDRPAAAAAPATPTTSQTLASAGAPPTAPAAPRMVYTPPPAGYRPGIDPEHKFYQPAAGGGLSSTGMGAALPIGAMLMKKGGKVKPKGKK